MRLSDLILAIIESNDGSLEGKTTIQKIAYFSTKRKALTVSADFLPHFYGPYSAQVDFELDKLVGLGFVSQSTRTTINDRVMYRFNLTDQGWKIAKDIHAKNLKEFHEINTIVKACREVAGLNPSTLSYAAKVHFILTKTRRRRMRSLTSAEVIDEAKKIGWKMSQREVRAGAKLLVELTSGKGVEA